MAKQKITEKEFVNGLQNKTDVPPSAAQNILKDIKEKVLPHVERVTVATETEEVPVTARPVRLIDETQDATKKPAPAIEKPNIPAKEKIAEKKTRPAKTADRPIANKPPEIIKKETPNMPKRADTYREPIE